jgi:uncharacterized membrane protein YedE/YeeE
LIIYVFVFGKLSLKPTVLGANIIGGLIFGLGWGMLGYCRGTAVGATGEGRFDAFWGKVKLTRMSLKKRREI